MHGSINLSVKVALSPDLTPLELGVYVRSRALLRTGRKAFAVADFKQLDGEELVRSALEHLLELGYVVHRGGGWYTAAKHPIKSTSVGGSFVTKIVRSSEQSKKTRTKKGGRYEQLGNVLLAEAERILGYTPAKTAYSSADVVNRASYRRILAVVDKFESSVKEFVWFVFQQDWSSLAQVVPYPRLLGSNSFLSSFEGYLQNKEKLTKSDDIFDVYDAAFGLRTARGLPEMRSALRLRVLLTELRATPSQFFSYAAGIQWRTFDGAPPLAFLASDRFFSQFRGHMPRSKRIESSAVSMYNCYLGRILSRLQEVPRGLSDKEFENCNWEVAEAIFEPLLTLVSSNGSDPQLCSLVARAVDEKHLPTFGFYVITKGGKFTPLAAYWITHAAHRLGTSFYPPEFGDWKDAVRDFSADQVDLDVLGLGL